MNEIRFEQAAFLQEHRSEVEQVKKQWEIIAGEVISNTLVQLTNFQLIERIIEVGEFVYNDDFTPTSLNLIKQTLEEVQEYTQREDFVKCENAIRELAGLMTRAMRNEQRR